MSMLGAPERTRGGASAGGRYLSRGAVAVAVAPQSAPVPRRPVEPRPRHLRVVAPAERSRRRLTPATAMLLTSALFAIVLAVAVAQTVLVEGQVNLDRLDTRLSEAQARYQQLRRDVARLESPERVVEAAQAQGMVTPSDVAYLQPLAPEISAAGPTTGDDIEPAADPVVGEGPDRSWYEIKSMLAP